MTKKTCGVYQIRNKITGERYIGSSKNIEERWQQHKRPNNWKRENKRLYEDFKKIGIDNFDFLYLVFVEEPYLKQVEQEMIDFLKPEYNEIKALGDKKELNRKWRKTEKGKQTGSRYRNKICVYNGEEIKFHTLATRFYRAGIPTPYVEARKYLK